MKQILIALLSGVLMLTGCAPATIERITPPLPSSTPTFVPATLTPSPTPIPPTATTTPLPTIPTFTPTFDTSTIVTAMPAPPAVCPEKNSAIVAKFATPDGYGSYEIYSADEILDYLNSGGTLAEFPYWEKLMDLTGDGLNEVVYKGLARYDILGCKEGKYQDFFGFVGSFGVGLADVLDLNKNGIPEVILYDISHYGFADVHIFEWNGSQFRSLIKVGEADSILATSPYKTTDINRDGLKEIVIVYNVKELCGGLGNPCDGTPIRAYTTILGWNGKNFVDLGQGNYESPRYRFQAIQDGDSQARYGNFAEALSFYQSAIFDDHLEWWSPEREVYEIRTYWAQYDPTPTVYPTAIFDNAEYPRLAAYAYHRIILLHIVQGHESDAGTVYKTLQQKFSADPYGSSYAEMATAFWNTYQLTEKIYDGCARAIQYAEEYPEILVPLGSDYHGWQSHTYVPADVCPFR